MDSNLTLDKCWLSEELDGILQIRNATRHVILLSAGRSTDFFSNANSIYKTNATKREFHGYMNLSHR